jgi:hypothetical protein
MTTMLFLDDQPLDRMDNVARRVGRPQLIPESVYIDPDVNTHFGYPTVFQDEASGKWRMLYQGRNPGEPNPKLMAESDDGLRWAPRDTTKEIDLPDRKHPHQLLPLEQYGQWNCFVDDLGDTAERIKAPVGEGERGLASTARMLVSPDGLSWKVREDARWHPSPPDPLTSVFWNDVRQSYVITTRPEGGDRRIAVIETKDWKNFSPPELALQTDPLDAPLTQTYGIAVIPYEGYYIGLLWLFHCTPEPPNKYLGGHMDCQLAYSLNGWHFQRGLRDPFIPNGPPGDPDSGTVYPSCMIPKEDGSLWFYASACTLEHGNVPKGDTSSLIAYSMRRDGFVYLESTGGRGTIGTRALYWSGGEAQLNVESQGGEVRVQVCDPGRRVGENPTRSATSPLEGYTFADCEPFSGDDATWTPTWRNGKTLSQLAGKALRLEVQLDSARLYAIRGDFVQMQGRQSRTFSQDNVIPEPRPGF